MLYITAFSKKFDHPSTVFKHPLLGCGVGPKGGRDPSEATGAPPAAERGGLFIKVDPSLPSPLKGEERRQRLPSFKRRGRGGQVTLGVQPVKYVPALPQYFRTHPCSTRGEIAGQLPQLLAVVLRPSVVLLGQDVFLHLLLRPIGQQGSKNQQRMSQHCIAVEILNHQVAYLSNVPKG